MKAQCIIIVRATTLKVEGTLDISDVSRSASMDSATTIAIIHSPVTEVSKLLPGCFFPISPCSMLKEYHAALILFQREMRCSEFLCFVDVEDEDDTATCRYFHHISSCWVEHPHVCTGYRAQLHSVSSIFF